MPATRSKTSTRQAPAQKPAKKGLRGRQAATTAAPQGGTRGRRTRAAPVVPVVTPPVVATPVAPPRIRPTPDLFVWGAVDSGQLGLVGYEDEDTSKPRRHPWAEQMVAKGAFGTEVGAGIVSVSSGGLHVYLLDENGSVWSSGADDDGALGRKVKPLFESTESPLQVASQFGVLQTLVEEGFHVVRLAAGDSVGAALNASGEVRVWGTFRNEEGRSIFSPTIEKQPLPISLSSAGLKDIPDKIAAISAGANHIVALTTQGDVYSWGIGTYGELGRRILARPRHKLDALSPQKVGLRSGSQKYVVIGTGLSGSFAVNQAGDVWSWGSNGRGQLGLGDALVGKVVYAPAKIHALSPAQLMLTGAGVPGERVVQICGGEFHTAFLTSAGRVFACGDSVNSQIGIPADHAAFSGSTVSGSISTPVLVPIPGSDTDPVVSISCGPRCTMAVTGDGVLFSWGVGTQGELGLGEDTDEAKTPRVVVKKTGSRFVTSVSCGGQHVVGLFRKRL